MGIGINDFRAMMGKYNLGELVIKTDKSGVKSLAKINNARYFVQVRGTADDAAKNREVRQAFYNSIESYLSTRGVGAASVAFLNELRQDLLGAKGNAKLSRQGDIARILDRLDHGVATGSFAAQQGNALDANRTLTSRVIRKAGFSQEGWRRQALENIVGRAREILSAPQGKELLKFIAKRAGCSVERVTTFLASRKSTILDKATVLLPHVRFGQEGMSNEALRAYVDEHIEAFAWQGIADAVRELHLETKQYAEIAKLSQPNQAVVHFLLGTAAVPVSELVAGTRDELKRLLNAFARLADGRSRTEPLNILGTNVTFGFEGPRLTATVGGTTIFVADADELLERTMKAVGAAKAGTCGVETIKLLYDKNSSLLQVDGNEVKREARTAQVAKWLLLAATNLTEVELQGLANGDLCDLADMVKDNNITNERLTRRIREASQKRMYSPAMLKTIQTYGGKTDDVVTFAENFNAGAPRPDPIHALAADLFCSEDVWLHDQDPNKDGTRLKEMLLAHSDAVDLLMQDDPPITGLRDHLPGVDVSEPLAALRRLLHDAGYKPGGDLKTAVESLDGNQLSEVERQIDGLVNDGMNTLQGEFTRLQGDAPVRREVGELWMQSLDEIVQGMKKSGETKEGQFFARVMNNYLTKAPISEKRAMMASALRLAPGGAQPDVKFGALLKGAGPVFQKILQGVSEGEIPPGLRGVFKDMKSNLAPIPKKAVNAMLRKLVADSKGSIGSIEVKDTLGSASVGQAFLCTVRFSDGSAKDCVVKMLKPDVQNRFSRERPILEEMAREVDDNQEGLMFKRLTARLETIQEELNFEAEVQNLRDGDAAYNDVNSTHKTISSNKSLDGVNSEMNYLALELVEGDPVDKFLSQKVDGEVDRILTGTVHKGPLYLSDNMDAYVDRRESLAKVLADLGKCQNQLMELAKLWFDTAVFGSGYFHGDLHAGNIMIGPNRNKATVIDFGNAMKIDETDRKSLEKLVCDAAARDVNAFLAAYGEIVPTGQKADFNGRKNEFSESIAEVFAKGELNDTGTRLAIALDMFERAGFSAPKSIYNFIQSQMRLQNAIDDVGLKIRQVAGLYDLQAPASLFAFRLEDNHENWVDPMVKMFVPYYPLLKLSKYGGGGTFGYDLLKYLPDGTLKDSFNWEPTRDAFLGCFAESDTMTDQDARAELVRAIQDRVVPLHCSLGAVKDKNGVKLNDTINSLVNAWNMAQRDTLDSAKAAAKVLLDGLWKIQDEASKGLVRDAPPKVQEYGEAVQDVIIARVSAMQFTDKLAFATNVGPDVCKKLLAEQGRQEEIGRAFETLETVRNHGFGEFPGLSGYEPSAVSNTAHWNVFLNSAKTLFNFPPEVRQLLAQMQKAAKNANSIVMTRDQKLAFAKSWLVNVKRLYKTAVATHCIPGVVCLDQAMREMVKDLNKEANPAGKSEEDDLYRIEDGKIKSKGTEYTFDQFVLLAKTQKGGYEVYKKEYLDFFEQPGVLSILEGSGGGSVSDLISTPVYIYRAVYAQGLLDGLLKAGESLSAMKDFTETTLAGSLALTDDEIDELAQQAFDTQSPEKGECTHTLEFYKDVIATGYARDVMAIYKHTVISLGS